MKKRIDLYLHEGQLSKREERHKNLSVEHYEGSCNIYKVKYVRQARAEMTSATQLGVCFSIGAWIGCHQAECKLRENILGMWAVKICHFIFFQQLQTSLLFYNISLFLVVYKFLLSVVFNIDFLIFQQTTIILDNLSVH